MKRILTVTQYVLLGVISLLLLVPKFLLAVSLNEHLWATFRWSDAFGLCVQDLVLAAVVFAGLVVFLRPPTLPRLAVAFVVPSVLLWFFLIDCRVRQLYLKPIDWDLIRYYVDNNSDLSSGSEVFFQRDSGLSITLRRWILYIGLAQVALWSLAAWVLRRNWNWTGTNPLPLNPRAFVLIAAGVPFLLLATACLTPRFMYRTEENPLTRLAVDFLTTGEATSKELREAAERFEQKLRPLPEVLTPPRVRLPHVAPFQNVVLVFLESFRWQDFELPGAGEKWMPTLARLAREGIAGKSYATIPHSCKSHFSVMTGHYPFPGLEIREAVGKGYDSFLVSLRSQKQCKTYCFSIANLTFENLRGILISCGVDFITGSQEMMTAAGLDTFKTTSFGEDDAALITVPARVLDQSGPPFAALMMPLGAHYPYYFDGKTEKDANDYGSYRKSLARTDRILGQMLENFEKKGLTHDTLFVLVGDHGESFGEHGLYVHNSSTYEEEITTPVIFWSSDGRMRDSVPVICRHVDLAPTILDLCGVHDSSYDCQGESLLRYSKPPAIFVSTFFENVSRALIEGSDKYIYWPQSGKVSHFDLVKDPREKAPQEVTVAKKKEVIDRLNAFSAYQKLLPEFNTRH